MPVYTRTNLTNNLWKVGEIWIPNKEEKNGNWTSVSGFGVGVYDIQVFENKEKNIYEVIFRTLGTHSALVGRCSYNDAYNEKINADDVPFIFGNYDKNSKIDEEKTTEILNKLPDNLKNLNKKFTKDYIKKQLENDNALVR